MKGMSHPEIVAGTVIFDKRGRLLLIRHPAWRNWIVAGGHVEFGESILEAARREAKEELGLDVKALGIIGIGEAIFPEGPKERRHYISAYVLCSSNSAEIIPNKEVLEHAWFTVKEALAAVKYNALQAMIRKYARERQGGKYRFVSLASDNAPR